LQNRVQTIRAGTDRLTSAKASGRDVVFDCSNYWGDVD
jgi:hypothetical protein